MNPWGGAVLRIDGERKISRRTDGEAAGELASARKARRLRARAGKRCGKCDHSFNLKLSGVNQECVAGRDGGED